MTTAVHEQLVRDVTEVTGDAPPEVVRADAPTLVRGTVTDTERGLYLVGLIGGKDVGKSALVNAMVGRTITAPSSHGEGTNAVVAYAHGSQADALRQLLEREVPGQYRIVTHDVPRLSRQVLLDLPDVDSHWAGHLEVTRRMLRHMLFPVWLQSIEKYADRQPQLLLQRVAEGNAPQNFVFCLNKVDQLLKREGPQAVEEIREDYARRIAKLLGIDPPRVYVLSAIHPDRHDLPALRELLSQEKSGDTVAQSKALAARQQDRSLLTWLDRQQLPARLARLDRLKAQADDLLTAKLATPLLLEAVPRLMNDPLHRQTLVNEVMNERVSRWPIVNLVHTLLSPVTGFLSTSLRSRAGESSELTFPSGRPESIVAPYLSAGGLPLKSALQTSFAHLQQSNPVVGELYADRKPWDELPSEQAVAELGGALASAIEAQRSTAVARIAGRYGIVSPLFRWLLTVGAVVWFPLAQPVLEVMLNPASGAIDTSQEALFLLVQLLGATYLLKVAGFLIIYFTVLWLILKWNTQRRVTRLLRRWQSPDTADPACNLALVVADWIDRLLQPLHEQRQRVEELVERTEKLRESLKESHA